VAAVALAGALAGALVLAGVGAALCLPADARAAGIDGVSDQSLPAWDGSFAASPLAALIEPRIGPGARQIVLARYVLQWNAIAEPSVGPSPAGDYRERFEAWLIDVAQARLQPVLALTSYDGVHPRSAAEYAGALAATLARAAALGSPIAYVEPWNEPNNQGHEPASRAAAFAGAAHALCAAGPGCAIVAGDFEDGPTLPSYERDYEAALTFLPQIWGLHPYRALADRDRSGMTRFRARLPLGGAGAQVWYTEVASLYCRHGVVLGQAAQAAQARFLRSLLERPQTAPAHAFYYGLQFADGRAAPCTEAGGDDSELYEPDDRPRRAAAVLLRGAGALQAFGPSPQEAAPGPGQEGVVAPG
jgi:hypothetical protein